MDVDPAQLRRAPQLRRALQTCGADLTLFEDTDIDILQHQGYRSVRGLRDATREGLTVAGLLPGLVDHILALKKKGRAGPTFRNSHDHEWQ
ncbi:hypothetical protein TSOC_005512 [Tetrabaena socialis]|uniref:Uncharacterized protein n=1 Tax=Tetrabaena socialis TaxID=47790 RepID=A0A2J8A635_9CHLO|nr:hypothetical protein TSOC_005512 [Tetrabaena socialis]|eukprot:PNH07986.1 hypothetical protein TSOC_005512 [Tetrabaena socialis]